MSAQPVLDTARRYVAGGLSVVPARVDGTKAPVCAWKVYQERQPSTGELAQWYQHEEPGVCIIGGAASGGLEVLDFDDIAAWEDWRPRALEVLRDAVIALPALPLVRTPSGGRHLYYRHAGRQQGNTKLARRASDGKVMIETRGQGGYVLAPGCPPTCHPTGRTYDLLQGDLAAIPTLSADARSVLLDVAKSLNEVAERPVVMGPAAPAQVTPGDGSRPGDIYASRARWDDLLRRHGWRRCGDQAGKGLWRRPGKEHGISATTNYAGSGYLYVWSTNAAPFEAERSYSLFAAYTLLECGGDYHLSALALSEQGYKAQRAAPGALPRVQRTGRQATDVLTGAAR